ncbi:MAG: hypothetical protein ACLQVD_19150 [Capsulimonadaceae bacterium]
MDIGTGFSEHFSASDVVNQNPHNRPAAPVDYGYVTASPAPPPRQVPEIEAPNVPTDGNPPVATPEMPLEEYLDRFSRHVADVMTPGEVVAVRDEIACGVHRKLAERRRRDNPDTGIMQVACEHYGSPEEAGGRVIMAWRDLGAVWSFCDVGLPIWVKLVQAWGFVLLGFFLLTLPVRAADASGVPIAMLDGAAIGAGSAILIGAGIALLVIHAAQTHLTGESNLTHRHISPTALARVIPKWLESPERRYHVAIAGVIGLFVILPPLVDLIRACFISGAPVHLASRWTATAPYLAEWFGICTVSGVLGRKFLSMPLSAFEHALKSTIRR